MVVNTHHIISIFLKQIFMLTTKSRSLVLKVGADLHYGEEVHQPKLLLEWSTMISYEMGSPPARVLHYGQYFFKWRTLSMDENMTWCQHDNILLLGEFSKGHISCTTSTLIQETWPPKLQLEFFLFIFNIFPSCPQYQILKEKLEREQAHETGILWPWP